MGVTKIGIVGCGVVGGALFKWFEDYTSNLIYRYDPAKKFYLPEAFTSEYIFICVPAETKEKDWSQDLTNIREALFNISVLGNKDATVFIRTTVLPKTTDTLAKEYNLKIVAMPEFLTERTAQADMEQLDIICGRPKYNITSAYMYDYENNIKKLFYCKRKPEKSKSIMFMENAECELTKYAHNLCLATKVGFWNVIKDECEKQNINYQNVVNAATEITGFISKSHTDVPGHDGKYGFGGKCFPPNLTSFLGYQEKGHESHMLLGLYADNNKFRQKPNLRQAEIGMDKSKP